MKKEGITSEDLYSNLKKRFSILPFGDRNEYKYCLYDAEIDDIVAVEKMNIKNNDLTDIDTIAELAKINNIFMFKVEEILKKEKN